MATKLLLNSDSLKTLLGAGGSRKKVGGENLFVSASPLFVLRRAGIVTYSVTLLGEQANRVATQEMVNSILMQETGLIQRK